MNARLPVLLLSAALAVAGCASEPEATRDAGGVVASEGAVGAFDLALGDCVQEPPVSEDVVEVEALTAVPCDSPHDGEVFALFDLPDGEFPGQTEVGDAGVDRCLEEFDAFIGLTYDESRYDFTSLFPSATSWADGDREYVCIAIAPDGEELTGTLQGVGA